MEFVLHLRKELKKQDLLSLRKESLNDANDFWNTSLGLVKRARTVPGSTASNLWKWSSFWPFWASCNESPSRLNRGPFGCLLWYSCPGRLPNRTFTYSQDLLYGNCCVLFSFSFSVLQQFWHLLPCMSFSAWHDGPLPEFSMSTSPVHVSGLSLAALVFLINVTLCSYPQDFETSSRIKLFFLLSAWLFKLSTLIHCFWW